MVNSAIFDVFHVRHLGFGRGGAGLLASTFGLAKTPPQSCETRQNSSGMGWYKVGSMDSRHRDWNEMFAAKAVVKPAAQPAVTRAVVPAVELEDLWAKSLALREHALHVRAVSMEVRAMARDMRMRREPA
jgi:hypothetical protein